MIYKDLLKKVNDIENLKEVDNIKCSTDTGEYTIENSKKGYLTNFNVEGKTLIDLWGKTSSDFSLWKATFVDGKINILTENDIRYSNFFTINYTSYKPDTIYTIIVDVDKNTLPSTSGIYIHSLGEENSVFIPNLTNIETAKTELNTKIDQLIAGGSNVASTQTITIDDWVEDAENGFKATVTHSLLTQRIVVNIIDATTKENVVTNFKIIDDNSIEIRSETRSELNVYVINGNAETHFINATVDDNRVSEMTTYSSKKIEDRFVNLEEKVNGGLSNIATSVNELITYC
ncbi:phage tail fiber protein [Clostridioides difficile]|nr:phage tail fiber protein [Clostridioides difficile]